MLASACWSSEEGFEDLEFWMTVMRLREERAQFTVAGGERGKGYRSKNGPIAVAEENYEQLSAEAFDAVVVPGGWAPDKLRRSERVRQ